MKNIPGMMIVTVVASFMLTACLLTPGPGGYGVEVAPALPAVVVLDTGPYYYHGGYHYYYQNDHWRYSKARNGPWTELPRSHYPKEIRHSERHRDRDRDRDRDGRDGDSRRDHDRK